MVRSAFLNDHKFVHCGNSSFVAAYEDFTNGNPASDVINMTNWGRCTFIVQKGSGAVGTATITVESCDDATPTTATAIPFYYRKISSGDTCGDWTFCAATGLTTAAAADIMYEITVDDTWLSGTNKYVRLQFTEVDSTAQDGSFTALLTEPRFADPNNTPTTLV